MIWQHAIRDSSIIFKVGKKDTVAFIPERNCLMLSLINAIMKSYAPLNS